MIAGHLTIEDLSIHFRIEMGGKTPIAHVAVSGGLEGQEESYQTDARDFMLALGVALDFDGGEDWTTEEMYGRMERTQPKAPVLRFIP